MLALSPIGFPVDLKGECLVSICCDALFIDFQHWLCGIPFRRSSREGHRLEWHSRNGFTYRGPVD